MATILYVHRFITSLVFTCGIETAVIFALLRYLYRDKHIDLKRVLFAGLFASFATVPYVWFVFPYAGEWNRTASLWVSEPSVFLIEALFYRMLLNVEWKKALTLSLIANVASFIVGPILRDLGLWIYW